MAESNYSVSFSEYSQRHYVKTFEKKYHGSWARTRIDIINICKRIDNMLLYKRADLIASEKEFKLVKLDFSVEGTRVSPKASGNRCVLFVNEMSRSACVLIVYSKNEIAPPNETAKWKAEVKAAFPDEALLFGL
jgi:hypothetical protein